MPVFDFRWNDNDAARGETDRVFAGFLIPAFACRADEDLTAAFCCVVDVPVVAAAGFKRYIGEKNAALVWSCQWIEIRGADEILGEGAVFRAESENVRGVKTGFGFLTCE